jgi:hypothetical protein
MVVFSMEAGDAMIRRISFVLVLLLGARASFCCDMGQSWVTVNETSSKILSPRAVEAMMDQMLSQIEFPEAQAKEPAKTVAITSAEIDRLSGGSPVKVEETGRLLRQVLDAASKSMVNHGFKVVLPVDLKTAIAPDSVSSEGFLSPSGMDRAKSKLAASMFLRFRLTDYNQIIRLDRSTLPGESNRMLRHVIDQVKGRLALQDFTGRYLHIGEVVGQSRQGTFLEDPPKTVSSGPRPSTSSVQPSATTSAVGR